MKHTIYEVFKLCSFLKFGQTHKSYEIYFLVIGIHQAKKVAAKRKIAETIRQELNPPN